MYGINMHIITEKISLLLRPATKDDLPELVKHFSSMRVHMHTMGRFGYPLENEQEWYEKVRKNDDECIWFIQPDGHDKAIGTTGLHHINGWNGSCSSGIIIWDPSWWGRGVASTAHLGRTLFVADYLSKVSIRSSVRVDNTASRRALERVGYTVWGTEPVDDYRAGRWVDTYHPKWFHPDKYHFYFPDGLPEKYQAGVERAKIALTKARQVVTFP